MGSSWFDNNNGEMNYTDPKSIVTAIVVFLTFYIFLKLIGWFRVRKLQTAGVKLVDPLLTVLMNDQCTNNKPIVIENKSFATVPELFKYACSEHSSRAFIGKHMFYDEPYEWKTYRDVQMYVQGLSKGLLDVVSIKPRSCVSIYAKTSPEWVFCLMALTSINATVVPLYDTLGDRALVHIIKKCQISQVICYDINKARSLLSNRDLKGQIKSFIIVAPDHNMINDFYLEAEYMKVQVHLLAEVVTKGMNSTTEFESPKPDDNYMISFTSGSSAGQPKGAVITHEKMISSVVNTNTGFDVLRVTSSDVYYSYLPLAHIMEQVLSLVMVVSGASIGYFTGDITKFAGEIEVLKPTVIALVPRLLAKLYDNVHANLETRSYITQFMFYLSTKLKKRAIDWGGPYKGTVYDSVIFKNIQYKLGGRLKKVICGSAPITYEWHEFGYSCLGVEFNNVYGLTETCGAVAYEPGVNTGFVPLPFLQVRVSDVYDMHLYPKANKKGELLVRCKSNIDEYYKDFENTEELLDTDSWLYTGDIVQLTEAGSFRIIDRIKQIFKLSTGEYVSPEHVESYYMKSPYIHQIFVDGRSTEAYPVAIIVPNPDGFRNLLASLNTEGKRLTLEESIRILSESETAYEYLVGELEDFNRANMLQTFEKVQRLKLVDDLFTVENGCLTPTLKLCRTTLRSMFKEDIESLYIY